MTPLDVLRYQDRVLGVLREDLLEIRLIGAFTDDVGQERNAHLLQLADYVVDVLLTA